MKEFLLLWEDTLVPYWEPMVRGLLPWRLSDAACKEMHKSIGCWVLYQFISPSVHFSFSLSVSSFVHLFICLLIGRSYKEVIIFIETSTLLCDITWKSHCLILHTALTRVLLFLLSTSTCTIVDPSALLILLLCRSDRWVITKKHYQLDSQSALYGRHPQRRQQRRVSEVNLELYLLVHVLLLSHSSSCFSSYCSHNAKSAISMLKYDNLLYM